MRVIIWKELLEECNIAQTFTPCRGTCPMPQSYTSILNSRLAVGKDLYFLESYKAAPNHLIQNRQECSDFLVAIDNFDDNRKILGETQNRCGMKSARVPKPHWPAEHGCTCKMQLAGQWG